MAMVFVIFRTVIRFYVHRSVSVDLACVYVAIAILISTAGIYTKITPIMFEIDRVSSRQEMPTVGFEQRADLYLRCQFALIVLFWTAIWAVKFSILMFYRDLFNKLPRQRRYWSLVFGYLVVSYLACWGTQLASCWHIPTYFHIGTVYSPWRWRKVSLRYQGSVIRRGTPMPRTIACTSLPLWISLVI